MYAWVLCVKCGFWVCGWCWVEGGGGELEGYCWEEAEGGMGEVEREVGDGDEKRGEVEEEEEGGVS